MSDSNYFRMKKILYKGPRSIITQNNSSPSALVCLANVLLLRGNTSTWFPPNTSTTTASELLSHITDLLLSATPADTSSPDFSRKINSASAFLPHLQSGMEVDVKFNGITEFSSSPGTDLFSILGIPLYHTWLVDPALESVSSVIGDLTRVELVHKILNYKDSADLVKHMEASQALEFIKSAPNQMTTYGRSQLTQKMDEGQLGVLFRNDDFVTICKHDGGIYQLVTDEGYLQRDDIVWKTLNSTDDAGKFVGHDFQEKGLTVATSNGRKQGYKYPLRETLINKGGIDDRRKNCPSGHQLKQVSYETRHREKIVDDPGWKWICDSCEDYFGLEGSRFRCDNWQLGTSCDYDLCGQCFNPKQLEALAGAEEKTLSVPRDWGLKQDYKASQVTSNVEHIETLGVDKGNLGGVSGKNCPGGHQLKEVDINTRLEDNPGWSCGCCLNYLELEGSRFRCDHWKLGTNCDFNLCGECFYRKEVIDDIKSNWEENGDYWKHVVGNIKQLLVDQKHSGGIWERFFGSFYENEFGEKIDFQKLGFPSQNQSNLMKFLNRLSGRMVKMEYIDSRMMIKPSKDLLAKQDENRADIPPLLESLHLGENSTLNTGLGVKKQVQYPPDLKEGDSLDILVTEVVSPAKFWFHLRGIETSGALDQLMDDMAEFYGDKDNEFEYRLENPCAQCESGAIMAAKYKDLGFHRVLINQICPRNLNKVKVFYVDYGTVGKIPISSVRILHDKFWELPAQALEAKLWGLTNSSGGKKWSRESSNRLHELVTPSSDSGWGCLAIVKRIQTHMGMVELELYDTMTSSSPGERCINQQLVQERHALKEQIPSIEENNKSAAPPAPMQVIKEVSDEVQEKGPAR